MGGGHGITFLFPTLADLCRVNETSGKESRMATRRTEGMSAAIVHEATQHGDS